MRRVRKDKEYIKNCHILDMFIIYFKVKENTNSRMKKGMLRFHYQNEYNYQIMSLYLNALIQNGFLIRTNNDYIAEEMICSTVSGEKLFDTFQNLKAKPVIRHKKDEIKTAMKDKFAQFPYLFHRPDIKFSQYSRIAKAYTVIRYLEINYHKSISYTLFNKIFPKLNVDIRTLELRYHKGLFRIDENKHIRVKNLSMRYFAPRITRNGNLLNSTSNKYFYPRTDKAEYVNNDAEIEDFIAQYRNDIELDNKSKVALTRREKDTLVLIENNPNMLKQDFVKISAKYFNIRKQNIYNYLKKLVQKDAIKIDKNILIVNN